MLVIMFKMHHKEITKNYLQTILKYFIGVQANFLLTAGFIFYIIFIVREFSIDKIFNQTCMDTIANATRTQLCPAPLAKSLFFNWRTEITQRRVTLIQNAKRIENSLAVATTDLASNQSAAAVSSSSVNSFQLNTGVTAKFSPVEDIYLLLISVSLINFFVSLVVPLIFIKASASAKQARTCEKAVQSVEDRATLIMTEHKAVSLKSGEESAVGSGEGEMLENANETAGFVKSQHKHSKRVIILI
jgi:hypothetical protein